jgi:hypothetical protein
MSHLEKELMTIFCGILHVGYGLKTVPFGMILLLLYNYELAAECGVDLEDSREFSPPFWRAWLSSGFLISIVPWKFGD